jgi:hypothetical protein
MFFSTAQRIRLSDIVNVRISDKETRLAQLDGRYWTTTTGELRFTVAFIDEMRLHGDDCANREFIRGTLRIRASYFFSLT